MNIIEKAPKGKIPKFLTEDEWNSVQIAQSLRNALDDKKDETKKRGRDELELERALQLLKVNHVEASRGTRGSAPELLWDVIALEKLDAALSGARLIFWWDGRSENERLSLGIYCHDFKTALIVSCLFGDTFRICPRCRKPFFTQSANKKYCSERCQGAHRVANHRFREKIRKQGGR